MATLAAQRERGGCAAAAVAVHGRGPARAGQVTLSPATAVFAGRERGAYWDVDLDIRTTRCFQYVPSAGGWRQVHHHGSIDNPELLRRYRGAVTATA